MGKNLSEAWNKEPFYFWKQNRNCQGSQWEQFSRMSLLLFKTLLIRNPRWPPFHYQRRISIYKITIDLLKFTLPNKFWLVCIFKVNKNLNPKSISMSNPYCNAYCIKCNSYHMNCHKYFGLVYMFEILVYILCYQWNIKHGIRNGQYVFDIKRILSRSFSCLLQNRCFFTRSDRDIVHTFQIKFSSGAVVKVRKGKLSFINVFVTVPGTFMK